MRTPLLHWPVDALLGQLAPLLPGVVVEVAGEIDSSNSELMRRARAGCAAPTLLVAETQPAVPCRLGREWQRSGSGAGGALAFSLGLPLAPRDWSGLSLAAGVAVAESLHPDIGLKWPNDLWWQGRKLAGILVETAGAGVGGAPRFVVVGVGINIARLTGEGFSTPPCWLDELLPGIDAPGALARVALPLVQALRAFEQQGFAPLVSRFAARDVLAGQLVRLSDGLEGVACGVGPGGELRVDTAQGLRSVHSAEVSVRPVAVDKPSKAAP